MTVARLLAIAALLAVVLGVLATSTNAEGDGPIVVTRDSGALPSGCTPRETAELLIRLADAVTSGEAAALDMLFTTDDPPGRVDGADGLAFRWFSVTEGRVGDRPWRHTVFYDRAPLFPYFAERHRQNERWDLIAVDMGASSSRRPGGVGIGYTIRRSADDLPESVAEFVRGKGEIDCVAQRIYLWSMGQDDGATFTFGTGCPLPNGWSPGDAVIACSRSLKPGVRTGSNARALLPDFRVLGGSARLPTRCGSAYVTGRLRSALSAFNSGRETAFAGHFATRALFHPYDLTEALVGRAAVARFVDARYEQGEGWTGATLRAPDRATTRAFGGIRRKVASYRLGLLLSRPGEALVASSAGVVVDFDSGLFQRWIDFAKRV